MPSGFVTPAGGAAAPVTRAQYEGNPVTIAAGASGFVVWTDKITGDALLSGLPSTTPTVVAEGVYVVAVTVRSETSLTVGTSFQLKMELDKNGADAVYEGTFSGTDQDRTYAALTGAYFIHASGDGGITLRVSNNDSVGHDFSLFAANVQRLS